MAESARQASEILRNTGLFQWYLIPFLAFILYVYAVEVERKRWDIILAGLAFYGLEWLFGDHQRPVVPLLRLLRGLGDPGQHRLPAPRCCSDSIVFTVLPSA